MTFVEDRDVDVFAAAPRDAARSHWLVNAAGALTSLALIAGLGIWGYRLALRDVTGIPVIRALQGPMRIAPPEPGGEIAANIGLSVNGIAAEGGVAPLADSMVLAPRPVELADQDQPVGLVTGVTDVAARSDAPTPAEPGNTGGARMIAPADTGLPVLAPGVLTETPPAAVPPTLDAVETSVDDALAEALGTDTATLASAEPPPLGAILRSPRPERRPEGDASPEPVPVAAAPSAAAPAGAEVDVATLTAGTRLVQLGAFDDEAGARAEWGALQARFGDLVASKALVLQKAQSGGRSFVRLRALGFDNEADARRFCSALLAEGASCIPVTHRL